MSKGKVIIIGGHGKVARLATPKLIDKGYEVESFIRNPGHAKTISDLQATPIALDIETAGVEVLTEMFKGAEAIVFSAGAGGGNPARTNAVDYEAAVRTMDAASKAGVKRYVMVSYSKALVDVDRLNPEEPFFHYAKAKHEADKYLRSTNLDYTILGPGALTLEPASKKITVAAADGSLDGKDPIGERRETSRENVAEVITYVLKKNAAIRETVNFYDGDTPISKAIS